ncbi:MAG: NAD(P)/FAD-dependent oxidoreductase [Clostridia bacterium]|nr:NAD(P)/FAD-dependent oxidoreductase [Clostridia bacterium]
MQKKVLIIGAGVIGCAIARELSRYQIDLTVLERGHDVCEGSSKANSGIVHAGFDAKPGTMKAKLNVEGSQQYEAFCAELGVPYSQPGAMVLAFTDEETETLQVLYRQGIENGVKDLSLLNTAEVLALEPNVNPEVKGALLAKTSGLVSPYELTYALADHAALNGAHFIFNEEAETLVQTGDGWIVHTRNGQYEADVIINCSGVSSAKLHNQISDDKREIINRRGQYWLLDHDVHRLFTMTMFQCPTKMGKGVLVSPTVHGNLLLGPTAEDIPDALDTSTTAEGLANVLNTARKTWPGINTRTGITNFSGIRAHEKNGDFIIGRVEGVKGAYETVGIESPGLTSCPAIAKLLADQVAEGEALEKKADFKAPVKLPKPFNEMTDEERRAAIAADPLNGKLICRCEVVTEGEIRAAIRRPVGATSIDGVKRRTRAGMGRCQGGFCSPRVAEILAEELKIPMTEVTKCGNESKLLVGTLSDSFAEV